MWRILPLSWLLSYFVFLTGGVFVAIWLGQGRPRYFSKQNQLQNLSKFRGALAATIPATTATTILLGKLLWAPLAALPWFQDAVFPDLGGEWAGQVQSNYLDPATHDPIPPIDVKAKIQQDFLTLSMVLESVNHYTDSRTVIVLPESDAQSHKKLWYLYEARTLNPAPEDSPVHAGSGMLEVRYENAEVVLEGLYWTNRNWQRRGNTAGTIKLRKVSR